MDTFGYSRNKCVEDPEQVIYSGNPTEAKGQSPSLMNSSKIQYSIPFDGSNVENLLPDFPIAFTEVHKNSQ
jgi:hypothetical protein